MGKWRATHPNCIDNLPDLCYLSIRRVYLLVHQANGSVLMAILIHLSINAGLALLFFSDLQGGAKTCFFLTTIPLVLVNLWLGKRTGFASIHDYHNEHITRNNNYEADRFLHPCAVLKESAPLAAQR